jgi:hypothetical protein
LDSFRIDLSYSLPLLVGFDLVEVDHGRRSLSCCRFREHEDKIVIKEPAAAHVMILMLSVIYVPKATIWLPPHAKP